MANPIDLHVADRIRKRRLQVGLSQEEMAEPMKISFQQYQKYERGTNRISAGKLYVIARTLEAPVDYFFEGAEKVDKETPRPAVSREKRTVHAMRLYNSLSKKNQLALRSIMKQMGASS